MARDQATQASIREAYQLYLSVNQHASEAIAKSQNPLSPREATEWSNTWSIEVTARLKAIKERAASTPPLTFAEAAKAELGLEGAEILVGRAATLSRVVNIVEGAVAETRVLAPRVASGDRDALRELLRASGKTRLALMAIDSETTAAGIAAFPPGHPQRSLAQSSLAIGQAEMEFLKFKAQLEDGNGAGAQATAERIQIRASEARTASSRVPEETKAFLESAANAPETQALMKLENVQSAYATYALSSQVELEIAEQVARAATALKRGDIPAAESAFRSYAPLVERRNALQLQRATALTHPQ
jgi:hypothetical protein